MTTASDIAQWLGYGVAGFVAFVFVCHMPTLPLLRLAVIDVPHKGRIARCFVVAWLKNCLTILPDLAAPLVVPVALLFTPRNAEHLPRLFVWWDSDASINGDGWAVWRGGAWVHVFGDELPGERPIPYDHPDYTGDCYYCKGHHPRSFYARWVWLGLRNRASRLSQLLGFRHEPDAPVQEWVGKNWHITAVAGAYRYRDAIPLGPVQIKLHYGYKVPQYADRATANLVAIGFSLKRAAGE